MKNEFTVIDSELPTHSPRLPKLRKEYHKANVLLFLISLCGLGLLWLLLPKVEISEIEKRELAQMPAFSVKTLLSGEYAAGIDLFVADTFLGRDDFVQLSHVVNEMRGIRPDQVRIYGKAEPQPQSPPQSEAELPQPQPPKEEASLPPAVSEESGTGTSQAAESPGEVQQMDGILIYQEAAMSLFGGSDSMAEYYASVINGYQEELPGVNIYNLVAPCSAEFYLPAQYQSLSRSQKANIDHIYESLNPGIKRVDAYGQLAAHTDEYIYFRTDHHWTALGAYYAYTAFCEQAGLTPLPLDQMRTRQREGFLGTLYAQTGDPKLQANPDVMDYYILPTEYEAWLYQKDRPYSPSKVESLWGEYASMVNSYSIFLHGDWPLFRIDTANQNGKKIVVVKESFGNAFVPFLLSHYETILVVDERYFQTSLVDLIEENNVTDLLFLNNIFAANTQFHIDNIRYMAHQTWTPPEPEESEESQQEEEEDEDE